MNNFYFYSILFVLNISIFSCERTSSKNVIKENYTLSNITTTGRISSNHFSDLALDANGNSYISSFRKGKNNQDYLYICKVLPGGKIAWEIGKLTQGRATAIYADPKDGVWVAGYYQGSFPINGIEKRSEKTKAFIVHLSAAGKLLRFIENDFGFGTPFDIAVNEKGEVMVAGVTDQNGVGFLGKKTITKKDNYSFISIFNNKTEIKSIESLEGEIMRIKSGPDNSFLITGGYTEKFSFRKDTFYTTGGYDNDAFFLYLKESEYWVYHKGMSGIKKPGYRTYEKGCDIAISESGNIFFLASLDKKATYGLNQNNINFNNLVLFEYSTEGKEISKKNLLAHKDERGAVAYTYEDGLHWIGTSSKDFVFVQNKKHLLRPQHSGFLLKLSNKSNVSEIILPGQNNNMLFRAATHNNSKVVLAGHYQGHMEVKGNRIENDGNHGVFLLEIEK